MTIPYAVPTDNECFSRTQFTSELLWTIARDLEHLAGERGRLAVAGCFYNYPLVSGTATTIKIPFVGFPQETYYKLQFTFSSMLAINGHGGENQTISVVATSYDTDDGTSHPSPVQDAFVIAINPLTEEKIGDYNRMQYADIEQGRTVVSGWSTHRCDPGIDQQRTLELSLTPSGLAAHTTLTGVFIMGFCPLADEVWSL